MNQPYMPIALRYAAIFTIITFVLGLVMGYLVPALEPSMTVMFIPSIFGTAICLVSAIAGLLVVRSQINTTLSPMTAGNGAVAGMVTGALIAVFSGVLSLLWNVIDPNFSSNMLNAMINAMDTMEMDQAAREQAIDQIMANDPTKLSTWLTSTGISILVTGIVNLISGIIGASIFSKKYSNDLE